ncbi:peptidyl-prolyl cis-trans isomerase [Bacillus sp. JCM 19045]|nr:peptidyl-prolyl cis-trans isomerase [Bacillus sp. JCM 19045]
MKKWIVIPLLMLLLLAACGTSTDPNEAEENEAEQNEPAESEAPEDETTAGQGVPEVPVEADDTPVVTMEMEGGEMVVMELYPDVAPVTVNNFVSLIEDGFYDGLTFHRIIPGFMIQGGDPVGNGTGGPGYGIEGEFTTNGVENDVSHERGVLSMARSQDPNSAGSQFFIMHEDSSHLDGSYAAFGKVIEGMDVVDQIAGAETDNNDKPVAGEEQTIKAITVER